MATQVQQFPEPSTPAEMVAFDFERYLKGVAGGDLAIHTTPLGALFLGDCLRVLPTIQDEVADCVFADPPFNLGKDYGPNCRDSMENGDYVQWCRLWLQECARILKPGGALFV